MTTHGPAKAKNSPTFIGIIKTTLKAPDVITVRHKQKSIESFSHQTTLLSTAVLWIAITIYKFIKFI